MPGKSPAGDVRLGSAQPEGSGPSWRQPGFHPGGRKRDAEAVVDSKGLRAGEGETLMADAITRLVWACAPNEPVGPDDPR